MAIAAHAMGDNSFLPSATPCFMELSAVGATLFNSMNELKLKEVHACCDALDPVLEERKRSAIERANRDTRLLARKGWLSLQCVMGVEKASTRVIACDRTKFAADSKLFSEEKPLFTRVCLVGAVSVVCDYAPGCLAAPIFSINTISISR